MINKEYSPQNIRRVIVTGSLRFKIVFMEMLNILFKSVVNYNCRRVEKKY